MENLNLTAYGVEEMNESDIIQTDGGVWLILGCIGIVYLCYYYAEHSAR